MDKLREQRKKANQKWDSAHMATLSVRLRKEQVEEFRKLATESGVTANALLKNFVLDYITKNSVSEE